MGKGDKRSARRKPGPRTPSGQLSRSKAALAERQEHSQRQAFEEGPQQVVLQARNRKRLPFSQPNTEKDAQKWREKATRPVSKDETRQRRLMERGSVLGRLRASGAISEKMATAGEDYCQRYLTYSATNGIPLPTAKVASYGAVRGGSRPDNIAAALAAKAAHYEDQRILRHCSAGASWAIKRACVLDEEAPLHLVVEGLRALVREGR